MNDQRIESDQAVWRLLNRREPYAVFGFVFLVISLVGIPLALVGATKAAVFCSGASILVSVAMFWGRWRDSPERFAKRVKALCERSWEAQFEVEISEVYVELVDPHDTKKRISWKDLRAVRINTTGMGPWVNDYWLVMESASQVISIPLGAKHFDDLLKRLSILPRWNSQAAAESLGSTVGADFVCWERDEAHDVQLQ